MNHRLVVSSALASVMALGLAATAGAASHAAAGGKDKEKCYGIAKAGQNDCANLSGTHSCAGQNKAADNDPGEWKYVAKGTCKDMKGLSVDEAKAKTKK
uniref:Signal peptide protein n=1 Tax=uncultured bacterium 51 TaxID=1748279 RepID=A0A0U3BC90_9BACT|nr:signal peptide protein [uncultured bacterium 51]